MPRIKEVGDMQIRRCSGVRQGGWIRAGWWLNAGELPFGPSGGLSCLLRLEDLCICSTCGTWIGGGRGMAWTCRRDKSCLCLDLIRHG